MPEPNPTPPPIPTPPLRTATSVNNAALGPTSYPQPQPLPTPTLMAHWGNAARVASECFKNKPPLADVFCPTLIESVTDKAVDDAKKALNQVLSECLEKAKTSPNELLNKFFSIAGTTDDDLNKINSLAETYQKILSKIDRIWFYEREAPYNPSGPIIPAMTRDNMIEYGQKFGYNLTWIYNPTFISRPDDERTQTIIHEAAHYIVGGSDHDKRELGYGYSYYKDFPYYLSQDKKFGTPDCYALFAVECSKHVTVP